MSRFGSGGGLKTLTGFKRKFGDEEEESSTQFCRPPKDGLIYIHTLKSSSVENDNDWIVMDISGRRFTLVNGNPHSVKFVSHPSLKDLVYYTSLFFESKMYFIGGVCRFLSPSDEKIETKGLYSNKIFVYDTKSIRWVDEDSFSSMKVGRGCHTAVVASKTKMIYVFGGISKNKRQHEVSPISIENWGECYSIQTNKWDLLPPPPLHLYDAYGHYASCPVYYEKKNQIFIWQDLQTIFVFDIDSNNWLEMLPSNSNIARSSLPWSHRVAIVGDIVFWHHFEQIYAYDLDKDCSLQVEISPNPFCKDLVLHFADMLFWVDGTLSGIPGNDSYLLSSGEGRLCLIWRNRFEEDQICFYSFLFKIGQGTVSLNLEGYSHSAGGVDCIYIQDVLAF